MLKIREINTSIYQLQFDDTNELLMHLGRFSNYYEAGDDSLYRAKVTWAKTMDIYKKKRNLSFFNGSSGINIPVPIMLKMAHEYKGLLTDREKFMVAVVEGIKIQEPGFKYLIATACWGKDPDEALAHEVCHGLWNTDDAYRMEMQSHIRALPKRVKDEIINWLKRQLYHESVQDDELQAYMATGFGFEEKEVVNLKLINLYRADFVDTLLEALAGNEINFGKQ